MMRSEPIGIHRSEYTVVCRECGLRYLKPSEPCGRCGHVPADDESAGISEKDYDTITSFVGGAIMLIYGLAILS